MQFFADDCPSAARADSAPPGALDGPSADDGLRGAMDRRCDTRTEALRAVARESPSIRRSSPGRRRSREKKEGGRACARLAGAQVDPQDVWFHRDEWRNGCAEAASGHEWAICG